MSDIIINGLPLLVNLEPCNVVDNEFVPKIPGVLGDELPDGQAFLAQANALEQSEIPAKLRLCMTEVKFHIWISLLPTLLWTSFSIFKPSNLIFHIQGCFAHS